MSVEDYMKSLTDDVVVNENQEITQLLKMYYEKFEKVVPTEMLPTSISEIELINAINKCIETNNDNIFEILNIKINYSNLY